VPPQFGCELFRSPQSYFRTCRWYIFGKSQETKRYTLVSTLTSQLSNIDQENVVSSKLPSPIGNKNRSQIVTTPNGQGVSEIHNISRTSNPNNTILSSHFTLGATIPPPKFDPQVDLATQFLDEVETYMRQKRLAPQDWISQLTTVFAKNPAQELWWKRTKIIAQTWEDFRKNFTEMYGSTSDEDNALEKLVLKRQLESESFKTFALTTELQYLCVHPSAKRDSSELLDFISKRAISSLRPHLLGSKASNLYELIKLADKIEPTRPPVPNKAEITPHKDSLMSVGRSSSFKLHPLQIN